jgi:nicotinate-nucleotide adenylyltransferase
VAEALADSAGLSRVFFVPSRSAPHKPGDDMAPADDRAAMVRLAIDGNPRFALSRLEIDRPGPSYTIDTVRALVRDLESTPLLILGVDAFLLIRTWHQWEDLVAMAPFALACRVGYDVGAARDLAREIGARVEYVLDSVWVSVSSTTVRERVAAGGSIRYLVPDPVVDYITSRGLYRPGVPLGSRR